MKPAHTEPIYTIGITAKLLNICVATLRIWERKGLIKPSRLGKNRFYSKCDVNKLEYIKKLMHQKRLNIEGVRALLRQKRCWDLKKCKPAEKEKCPVYIKYKYL